MAHYQGVWGDIGLHAQLEGYMVRDAVMKEIRQSPEYWDIERAYFRAQDWMLQASHYKHHIWVFGECTGWREREIWPRETWDAWERWQEAKVVWEEAKRKMHAQADYAYQLARDVALAG